MGEIDTKPIESVQTTLSIFGENGDERKNQQTGIDGESEKERRLEAALKGLANYKVQLEAKDAACMQTFLKLEHKQNQAHDLSILLKSFEMERNKYLNECIDSRTRIEELESKMKEMENELSENLKIRQQLSNVLLDLNASQEEMLRMEKELNTARDSESKALAQLKQMDTRANTDKDKIEQLLRQVSELNNAIHLSKDAAFKAKQDKLVIISVKDAEIDGMRKKMEIMQELENQLLENFIFIETLTLKLKEANDLLGLSHKAAFDSTMHLKLLREELERKEGNSLCQAALMEALKLQMNQTKLELKNSNDFALQMMDDLEMLTEDLQNAKVEIDEIQKRETDAKFEVSLLKSELEKERSKATIHDPSQISVSEIKQEMENLKEEFKAERFKVAEIRNTAEQATSRAELAEKAKEALEDQIRKWREHKQKRKAAIVALKEVSTTKEFNTLRYENTPKVYQPLATVIVMNMTQEAEAGRILYGKNMMLGSVLQKAPTPPSRPNPPTHIPPKNGLTAASTVTQKDFAGYSSHPPPRSCYNKASTPSAFHIPCI